MNVVSRGIKNAFRNSIRTFSIIVILGISVGLSLSMLVARQAVEEKITTVKSSVGNTITVSPAGARGFEGGGEALTTTELDEVEKLANVSSVTKQLSDRLTSENTSLESSIEPGTLGNRAQGNSGVGFQAPPSGGMGLQGGSGSSLDSGSTSQVTRTFTPPVTVTGASNLSSASVYGGDTVTYTSGEAFAADSDELVAVVGKAIAEKNSLAVGSTFTAYGNEIKVVGIYDTGNTFANNGVIMPLRTVQKLSDQANAVTSATVTVDSVDHIDSVVSSVKTKLGSKADVVSDQETAQTAVEPLESVKTISTYSVIGALATGAVIILLTMMMIVRERRREIGVMKAIGSSNAKTVLQFISEALTLTVIGMVVGIAMTLLVAQPITKMLVTNSSSSTTQSTGMRGGPGGPAMRRPSSGTLRGIEDIKTSAGIDLLAYGFGAALIIAIIGSALPAYLISKVRPAEVMRAE